MSMKSEFEKIIRNYGHDIFLQRHTLDDKGLPIYDTTFERHTIRHRLSSNRSLTGAQREMMEGVLNTSERIYYFRTDAIPSERDRIYEEDDTKWSIDQVMPLRGENGIISYYVAGATRIRAN